MLLVKAFARCIRVTSAKRGIWEQRGMRRRWNYFLLEEYPINVMILGMRTNLSLAVSSSYYWMLVQNNYLLGKKNDRTLTLQTYWICIACLQAISGVIQFCLRRTTYYERWVKKASALIAHQNHYRSTERASAASGQTRQRWSQLPRDKIQFTLLEAIGQRAISPGNRSTDPECAGINSTGETELIAYTGPDDL